MVSKLAHSQLIGVRLTSPPFFFVIKEITKYTYKGDFMENPQYPINLIKGQWNKVLTGVTGTGTIHRKTYNKFDHLQTYRLTGAPAPTSIDEGIVMFLNNSFEPWGSDSPIDIYVWPVEDSILRSDR